MEVEDFIAKWTATGGAERSNTAPFIAELCDLLGVPRPGGVTGDPEKDTFVLEQRADMAEEERIRHGRIDVYKKGCFILEAKQGTNSDQQQTSAAPRRGTYRWTQLMRDARGQAEAYAYASGLHKDPPPFLIVADVGYAFDLYACFDETLRYRPFPDPPRSRIFLKDLADHLDLFRTIFSDPNALDPSKRQAQITRQIAGRLAELARTLEEEGHDPELVAAFLMRCIFTMFAEDVELLPNDMFTDSIKRFWLPNPQSFVGGVESLWRAMNEGGETLMGRVLQFNGGLFREPQAVPLNEKQLQLLLDAAERDWSDVEPAIFGTLLERALDKKERHRLGAHYTPRAYVERLVRPTMEEPLRSEWEVVQLAVRHHIEDGREKDAVKTLQAFQQKLANLRILDPACGSGNFLYVSLDLLKQLEAEVLSFLSDLGQSELFDVHRITVTPDQFLGIEVKSWAKEIAELVLWIGYLRWHFKARGEGKPPQEPVLRDYHNIECRDAVLEWDGEPELVTDEQGKPVTRWDGETMKLHAVTGEEVPDESARAPVYRYKKPRRAQWPVADFIIGNPPFVGNKRMRAVLGDGYVDALRQAHDDVPETVDYVMYWWNHAAKLVRGGETQRFGFITTNSVSQSQSRQVLTAHMEAKKNPLHLAFAIPDHPWVDSESGAAVRIAMTVADTTSEQGRLVSVMGDAGSDDGVTYLSSENRSGKVHPNLTVGPAVTSAVPLEANDGLSYMGVTLVGEGFRLTEEDLSRLDIEAGGPGHVVRPYTNGRDITKNTANRYVIDLYGKDEREAQEAYPQLYQWLQDRVYPARQENKRAAYRERWWIFGEPRGEMRKALAGLDRYIATLETSRHRYFVFLNADVLADHSVFVIASNDAYHLGVLSSRVHVAWTLAAGSRLGVGNDYRYRNRVCFLPFPFPDSEPDVAACIRDCAERLDAHRKKQLEQHDKLTITAMYNVLEKLRGQEELTAKDRTAYEEGLVGVLKEMHDELDRAVFDAYGWPSDLTDEAILERLVSLNAERAAEEAQGLVRWMRPEFQNPDGTRGPEQTAIESAQKVAQHATGKSTPKWPKKLEERIVAVRDLVHADPTKRPWSVEEVAAAFKGARRATVQSILEGLRKMGHLELSEGAAGEPRYRVVVRTAA